MEKRGVLAHDICPSLIYSIVYWGRKHIYLACIWKNREIEDYIFIFLVLAVKHDKKGW